MIADERRESCDWIYCEPESGYATTCGETFCFDDGTAEENGVRFCHHCGGRVRFLYKCDECDAGLPEQPETGLCPACLAKGEGA